MAKPGLWGQRHSPCPQCVTDSSLSLSLSVLPWASRTRGIKYCLFVFWQSQSLASVPGAGSSYRHRGLAAERSRVRRRTRRAMQGWGQPVAEVFWPSRSDRPGRACVRVVRELELFLLTLRPQMSSGQPSPLPELLLPSSPGEERRLGQANLALGPQVQCSCVWASHARWHPAQGSLHCLGLPRLDGHPGQVSTVLGDWSGAGQQQCPQSHWRPRGWKGPSPAPFCSGVGLHGTPMALSPRRSPHPQPVPGPHWRPGSLRPRHCRRCAAGWS